MTKDMCSLRGGMQANHKITKGNSCSHRGGTQAIPKYPRQYLGNVGQQHTAGKYFMGQKINKIRFW